MENKKIESLEIKLDGLIYQEIQEYCVKYSADETEFVNAVMIRFFKENKKNHDTMRKGYAEMSEINLDICNEFEGCEKDVSSNFERGI